MSDEGRDFDSVLKEAQDKGFAEADPSFDVEGIDSAHKIAVISRLIYGTPVNFDDVYILSMNEGDFPRKSYSISFIPYNTIPDIEEGLSPTLIKFAPTTFK